MATTVSLNAPITDVSPGDRFSILVRGQTISPITYRQEIAVVWVESGHVHYRIEGCSRVGQTPISRFLEILNNQPK
jgi:hypothetical protein